MFLLTKDQITKLKSAVAQTLFGLAPLCMGIVLFWLFYGAIVRIDDADVGLAAGLVVIVLSAFATFLTAAAILVRGWGNADKFKGVFLGFIISSLLLGCLIVIRY